MKFASGEGEARRVWVKFCIALLVVGGLVIIGASLCEREEEELEAMAGGLLGQPKDVKSAENSLEIEEIGRWSVQEHNKKEGKNLTFKKVVSAKEQVVSGTMYHLTVEAAHGHEPAKKYETKVWHKPWENHKSLESFHEAGSSHSVSCDTQQNSGSHLVSSEDPVVREAAKHALNGLNRKSNSLVPYELKEILSAQAKAVDVETEYELHIKVSKGGKEEDLKAGLLHTKKGEWTVKHSNLV